MNESQDALRQHVAQIVGDCRRLPRHRQRAGVIAFCRRLFSNGMHNAAVFAIERQCLHHLSLSREPENAVDPSPQDG